MLIGRPFVREHAEEFGDGQTAASGGVSSVFPNWFEARSEEISAREAVAPDLAPQPGTAPT